jgi:primase-polymerase (primpol)-like protein
MVIKPPPPSTTVNADNIPTWLKAQRRWGLWKPVWRIRRWEKVPVLSTNKPEQWLTFDEAMARKTKEYGIGFLLTGIENFTAFDLDHCLDRDGKPEPWAAELINRLSTYTEVTVSGDGIRMFVHGRYASDWVNKDTVSLEVYSGNAGRFVTVSGDPWLGAPEEIMTVSDEVLGAIEAELRLSAHSEKVIVGARLRAAGVTPSGNQC